MLLLRISLSISSTTRNKRFRINEELLLSPACNSELTGQYRYEMLAALFVLIAATRVYQYCQ